MRGVSSIRHSVIRSLRHCAAFTLIELICVIVILGVMATMFVPRVLNTRSRAAELEAAAAQALCTLAAQKTAVWSLPVAIDYKDNRLTLWARRADAGASSDAVGTATAVWKPDPLADPVVLTELRLARATLDGQPLPNQSWRIEFSPGQPRPALTLELEPNASGSGPAWRIALDPDAGSAQRSASRPGSAPPAQASAIRTIDLDDAGKGTAPW